MDYFANANGTKRTAPARGRLRPFRLEALMPGAARHDRKTRQYQISSSHLNLGTACADRYLPGDCNVRILPQRHQALFGLVALPR